LCVQLLPYTLLAQRTIDKSIYTQVYYDSIRTKVSDSAKEHYVLKAHRLPPGRRISIDGRLEESAWYAAEHAGNFIEKEPYPLVPSSEKTEFAILYDDENVYAGFWCWDSDPDKIVQQLNPRNTSSPDNVQIFFDTYHDQRTGYKFTISPTGVQMDELRYDDVKRDLNWNGVWYSAAHVDDRGWYAEARIPLYNLRFRENREQIWGVNVLRHISKNASRAQWKPHLPEWENSTRMSTLGDLVGIGAVKSGRMFEVRPYGVTGFAETLTTEAERKIGSGFDLRFTPSSNLTADLTINPDFAQVDADVLVINLTRFPTRFGELRPFFTERTNIFNTPIEQFYSRRIGARGDIIAGGKITGRSEKGLSYGVLAAASGKSPFSSFQNNVQFREEADFAVARVKKDLFSSSSVGILAATKEEQGRYNRTLGMDGSFVLTRNHLLDIQIAKGSTEAFKKRDMAYYNRLQITGDVFGFIAEANRVEPFFDINRIGFMQKEMFRGWNAATGELRVSPRINKHRLRRINALLAFNFWQDMFTDEYLNAWLIENPELEPAPAFGALLTGENGGRTISDGMRESENWQLQGELNFQFLNEAGLSLSASRFRDTEVIGRYSGKTWEVQFTTRPASLGATFEANAGISGGDYYNFTQKYAGSHRTASISGNGRLAKSTLTRLQGEFTRTYAPDSRRDGQFWQLSSYTTFMFNKDFYLRLHLQGHFETTYHTEKISLNDYILSWLLSWQYRPGAFFFIAYNEGRLDETDGLQSRKFFFRDRTLVVKLSYFFTI
jgi:hypothetical protein